MAFLGGFLLVALAPAAGVGVLAGTALVLALGGRPAGSDRTATAWAGLGPGVFLGLAAVAAVTMSSLATFVAGNWLNGSHDAADMLAACAENCSSEDPHLLVPVPYTSFGVGVLIGLLAAGLVLAGMLVVTAGRGRSGIPTASGGPATPPVMAGPTAEARRFAATVHRAEGALAWVAGLGTTAVVAATAVSAAGWPDRPLEDGGLEGLLRKAVELGAYALGAVGVALFGALIGAGGRSRTRPLGLVWDLVCFLPRAAHPFGPPCYAERTVPELVSRCEWWLDTARPAGAPATGRRGPPG